MFEEIIAFIKSLYGHDRPIALHEPRFIGKEKEYLLDVIDSTFVSSMGKYLDELEHKIKCFVGAKYAITMINGTSALHTALLVAGVKPGDEILTQPISFVATVNAMAYVQANPVFIDVSKETLGLDPVKLEHFLSNNAIMKGDGYSYNKQTGNRIRACIPVHILGHPVQIDEIKKICEKYNIILIEDAAESLGSFYKKKHTGTFGAMGIFSFNGNKIVTGGNGAILVTNEQKFATDARHISTTAKCQPEWRCFHDKVGYNYKLSNLNAALICAQLENLSFYLQNKRETADLYKSFFKEKGITFISEPKDARSNYWLNAIMLNDSEEKEKFISFAYKHNINVRPLWFPLYKLPMYQECQRTNLDTANWLIERVITLPSSVRI